MTRWRELFSSRATKSTGCRATARARQRSVRDFADLPVGARYRSCSTSRLPSRVHQGPVCRGNGAQRDRGPVGSPFLPADEYDAATTEFLKEDANCSMPTGRSKPDPDYLGSLRRLSEYLKADRILTKRLQGSQRLD